jgi:hypothetical protein
MTPFAPTLVELRICDVFRQQITHANRGERIQRSRDAQAALSRFHLDEILAAYVIILDLGSGDHSGYVTYVERVVAQEFLKQMVDSVTDDVAVGALTALYARSPDGAKKVASTDAYQERPWRSELPVEDLFLELPAETYEMLGNFSGHEWCAFVVSKFETSTEEDKLRRDLAATLACKWRGTGLSFIDTVDTLSLAIH